MDKPRVSSVRYTLVNERTKERQAVDFMMYDGEPMDLSVRALVQTGARLYARGWDVHEVRIRRGPRRGITKEDE